MIHPFEKKVWLSTPTRHEEEMTFVREAFDTNWKSTVGENITEAERAIRETVGCDYAVALSCGTAAVHLCVKLAGIGRGDKVATSDVTFAATANPVVYEGGTPVFIDTEYDTWNMDPDALERAFSLHPEIRAVIVANLYGTPGKMDEIASVCRKHGAILIEDAAESLGSTYKGKQTGSFGTYNAISFNGNKIITGSSGGMLLTDDAKAAEKARKWSTQSREDAPWYQHEELGYNYRMGNIVAGILRGQIPYLEEHIAEKRAIYERYREGFADLPVTMNPYDTVNAKPNHWLSCLLIKPEAMCRQVRTANEAHYEKEAGKTCPTEILETLARYNAEGRPIWKPMHAQPYYASCPFVTRDGKDVGMDIFDRGLCLPSDNKMTPDEQDTVIEIVRSCFA